MNPPKSQAKLKCVIQIVTESSIVGITSSSQGSPQSVLAQYTTHQKKYEILKVQFHFFPCTLFFSFPRFSSSFFSLFLYLFFFLFPLFFFFYFFFFSLPLWDIQNINGCGQNTTLLGGGGGRDPEFS